MAGRYLYGDTRPVQATVATAYGVTVGDLVGLSSNTLISAADAALWDTNTATTQTAFRLLFLGVSGQTKRATTDTKPYGQSVDNTIRVDADGVYEYDIASATVEVGEFYGPAKDTGNNLLAQKLVKVASEALAVAQCVERGTSVTKVKVKLLSYLAPAAPRA